MHVRYTDKDVVIEIDSKKHGFEGASGDRIKESNLEEWEVGSPSVRIERSGPTGSGSYYSNVVFCVYVHRKAAYYFYKIMLIILLLVLISEFTFFMDVVDDFPDRLNTSITLILASVAFLYVASESLPRISYLTVLDKMMLFSFIMLFMTALESFVAYVLAVKICNSSNECLVDESKMVDMVSAIAYPVSFVLYGLYLSMGARRVRRAQKAQAGDDHDAAQGCCARIAGCCARMTRCCSTSSRAKGSAEAREPVLKSESARSEKAKPEEVALGAVSNSPSV